MSTATPGVTIAQPDLTAEQARQRMVRDEVVAAGITDPRVQLSLANAPRHLFVPPDQQRLAYYDMALPIGAGQTISPPFVVAYMTQALSPQPGDKVLEIGTGSGYQAAVLSPLVAEVYTIEIVESLGRRAAQTLRRLRYDNVHVKVGDGFQGWPEHAPFDKIIVTCSPDQIPRPLVEQLREGGRMVVPLGERYQQTLYLMKKTAGEMVAEALQPTFFVPMTGRAEELRQIVTDEGIPRLVNGGFEQIGDDNLPVGWYYVRQAEITDNGQAPEGTRWLRLRNETPGRHAQALQAVGMDGRQVRKVELTVRLAGNLPRGAAGQVPRVEVNFFDERRAAVGSESLLPTPGTSAWTVHRTVFDVPATARLAVLAVGLFGATGELSVDDVTFRVVRPARQ